MRSRLLPSLLLAAVACGDDLRSDGGGGRGPDGSAPPAPDAGGSPPDIQREQAGGSPTAVQLAGDLAYLAIGPRLQIWRDGELVGESAPLSGIATAIALAGERA